MNTDFRRSRCALLCSAALGGSIGLGGALVTGAAMAQESPAPAANPAPANSAPAAPAAVPRSSAQSAKSAQMEAGEPRADTSGRAPADAGVRPLTGTAARASKAGTATAAGPGAGAPGTAGQKPKAADRLDLGTATVTGDREQPKVMYIVPWKSSDIGDQSGKPMNSLLDEALAPVDRDVFKREVAYYDAVRDDAPQNGASNPAAKLGEK